MLPFIKKVTSALFAPSPRALKARVQGAVDDILRAENADLSALVSVTPDLTVSVAIEAPTPPPSYEPLRQEIESALREDAHMRTLHVVLTNAPTSPLPTTIAQPASRPASRPASQPTPSQPERIKGVKHVIMVASGKGGVGKSTVAANLAVALTRKGVKVGLLDADIYGPSVPTLMGLEGHKPDGEQGHVIPLDVNGLKVMSIGFMVAPDSALIWRGPILHKALQQLSRDVAWGDLDILLIDMPPGTGDIPLSLAQKLVVDGAVIVSTPQDLALIDTRRGIAMFEKVGIPVLGVIENMSTHICSACGYEDPIFGSGGAEAEANKMGAPFLGNVPLSFDIRSAADQGEIVGDGPFPGIADTLLNTIQH